MALITCRDICISYENQVAVEHVSFQIEAGDCIYIVGENGSGKSTLIKGLLGLLPLQRGEITLGDGLRRDEVGYLPQQTAAQRDFPASVEEIVLSGCLNRRGLRPFYNADEKKRAEENMRRMGVLPLRRRSYAELSGGQQQRVLLARAMCATRKILLLDEPVTGLDPIVSAELYGLIGRLNRDEGTAIVMVSHDIASAVKNAKKILHMDTALQFFGPVAEYMATDIGKRMMGGGADA